MPSQHHLNPIGPGYGCDFLILNYIGKSWPKVALGELQQAQRILGQIYRGMDIDQQAIYLFGPVLLAEARLQLARRQPFPKTHGLAALSDLCSQSGFIIPVDQDALQLPVESQAQFRNPIKRPTNLLFRCFRIW